MRAHRKRIAPNTLAVVLKNFIIKTKLFIFYNWASETSPTLGCSIENSRDIYMYVCIYVGMSSIVYGKTLQKNRMLKYVGGTT